MENINLELICGILGLIFAVWGIFHIIKPKLIYIIDILPYVAPSNVDENIKNKLKITYNNQEVDQLSLARVTICNKGQAIAENFSKPIIIKFNKKILYAIPNIENVTSGILNEYSISDDNTKIEFMPQFINQGESIFFDVVIASINDIDIKVIGRCKGCSTIKLDTNNRIKNIHYFITLILFLLIIFSCYKLNAIKNELAIIKRKEVETYSKLLNLCENDEKNIHEDASNIITYGDAIEAYITCKHKLSYYIGYAKERINNDIENLTTR